MFGVKGLVLDSVQIFSKAPPKAKHTRSRHYLNTFFGLRNNMGGEF